MWKSGHDGWRQIGLPLGLEGLGDRPIWTTSRLAGARPGSAKKAAVEFASLTEPGAPRIARPSPIHHTQPPPPTSLSLLALVLLTFSPGHPILCLKDHPGEISMRRVWLMCFGNVIPRSLVKALVGCFFVLFFFLGKARCFPRAFVNESGSLSLAGRKWVRNEGEGGLGRGNAAIAEGGGQMSWYHLHAPPHYTRP